MGMSKQIENIYCLKKIKSRLVIAKGQWGEGMGNDCLIGIGFPFGVLKMFQKQCQYNIVNVLNVTNDTFKLCVFHHNFKKCLKIYWNFYWDCIEYLEQFQEN